MKHPLADLAALQTRERIRSALGPCVDVDPDAHAERVVSVVLRVRVGALAPMPLRLEQEAAPR